MCAFGLHVRQLRAIDLPACQRHAEDARQGRRLAIGLVLTRGEQRPADREGRARLGIGVQAPTGHAVAVVLQQKGDLGRSDMRGFVIVEQERSILQIPAELLDAVGSW